MTEARQEGSRRNLKTGRFLESLGMRVPLLGGLRVLDLTHYIAGPYCTRLLAGLGAEVIKVERPLGGDPARRLPPFYRDIPGSERSGTFLWLNVGKKGITLDLKRPQGIELLLRLVAWAEVLVENFAPRVLPGLGLTYARLAEVQPRLVLTSISNFGQDGPYRDYRAQDIVLFGMGGSMASLTPPEQEPLTLAGFPAQIMAGAAAFTATLGALYGARAAGEGQHVDVSIFETMVSAQTQELVQYAYLGVENASSGNLGLLYPCRDGYAMIIDQQPHQWARIAQLVGHPELAEDPRLQTMAQRREHRDIIDAVLGPWMQARTKAEVYHAGQAAGIPSAMFATVQEVVESPQIQARGFFMEVEHPEIGRLRCPGMPFHIGERPTPLGAAPLLGQHNTEVFGGLLGLTPKAVDGLRRAGVVS
jgi:crotonobetainyl-CoA:carnitine CoA-transferase CaiB-like acyl-CoA transferase